MQVSLHITLAKIGPRWVALTEIGGIRVKSGPALKPEPALKELLWKLSGNGPRDDDAELGIALLVSGTTLDQEVQRQALPPAQPAAPGSEDEDAVAWMREHPDRTYQDYLDEEFQVTFRPAPNAPGASST